VLTTVLIFFSNRNLNSANVSVGHRDSLTDRHICLIWLGYEIDAMTTAKWRPGGNYVGMQQSCASAVL